MFEIEKMDYGQNGRRRVLLIAYACSPFRGSEQGIGWHRSIESAKYNDTWVICKKEKNEEDIRRYFSMNGEIQNLKFCFIPRTHFQEFLKRIPIPFFWYFRYNLWHRRALRLAVALHNKNHFHLCHQVNMSGFREPGYLWKLNIPFIWGPVGGTENASWHLIGLAGIMGAITEGLRNLINNFQFKYSLRVRKAARKASIVLAANSDGQNKFRRTHKIESFLLSNNGISSVKKIQNRRRPNGNSIRILWSSRLTHNKCLPLLFRALAIIPNDIVYELRILGDGPQREGWKQDCKRLGIEKNCQWMGSLPHDQAKKEYEWADVFVFTSLRDAMGTVVLEALSYGVPVITLDHSGSHDAVTNDCGIKIPVTTAAEVILRLRDAIILISQDRTKLEEMGHKSIERAREYLWSRNGEQMAQIYEQVLKSKSIRNAELSEKRSDAC